MCRFLQERMNPHNYLGLASLEKFKFNTLRILIHLYIILIRRCRGNFSYMQKDEFAGDIKTNL